MTDLIERVARAITIAEGDDPDGHTGSLLNNYELWWEHRIPQARAAIAAMRELPGNPGPRYTAGEYSRRTQEAMVDDALSQPPQHP
jgi:hypothetical protein